MKILAAIGLGIACGIAVSCIVAHCDTPVPPIVAVECPACDTGKLDDCIVANMSMGTALEGLALREDGCAAFLHIPVTDDWVKYRMAHDRSRVK